MKFYQKNLKKVAERFTKTKKQKINNRCQKFNSSGPSRYRIGNKNAHKQFCYFNQRKKEKEKHVSKTLQHEKN